MPFFKQTKTTVRVSPISGKTVSTSTGTSPDIPRAVDPLKGTRYSLAPVILKKIDKRSKHMNTDNNGKTATSTMVGDDLVKKINMGVNTELVKENVLVYQPPPKIYHFREGYKVYYDEEADVLGVDCFICCNGCWKKCKCKCFKGCRNSISCPLYTWICFIGPLFFILSTGIIVSFLIWIQYIPTITKSR